MSILEDSENFALQPNGNLIPREYVSERKVSWCFLQISLSHSSYLPSCYHLCWFSHSVHMNLLYLSNSSQICVQFLCCMLPLCCLAASVSLHSIFLHYCSPSSPFPHPLLLSACVVSFFFIPIPRSLHFTFLSVLSHRNQWLFRVSHRIGSGGQPFFEPHCAPGL